MTSAVRVRGLRKEYPGQVAVDNVDLDIEHGEVFALLGPNGAGKTTTVEILAGYRRSTAGEVRVLGEDPRTGGRAWRARIGIVLQTVADAAQSTVAETVRHFARCYPNPHDPDEVIERVGLTEKARARVRSLSGGQRRRLDVALGIVGRPELLFLDEPTTGFDPEARRRFWELISGLAHAGTTILLTTHYLDEAEALADRVAVLVAGSVVAEGSPGTIGGRSRAEAVVRWRDELGYHEERTPFPTKLVTQLARDGELAELTVSRPSLEDVYLNLIGENG